MNVTYELKDGSKEYHLLDGVAIFLATPCDEDDNFYIVKWSWELVRRIAARYGYVVDGLLVAYGDRHWSFKMSFGDGDESGTYELWALPANTGIGSVCRILKNLEDEASTALRNSKSLGCPYEGLQTAVKQLRDFQEYLYRKAPRFKDEQIFTEYVNDWFEDCIRPITEFSKMYKM